MPKVTLTEKREIALPEDFLERRHFPRPVNFWLDERNGEFILQPCLPDIHKVYIEPTTSCNLSCRMCIRNAWGDPIEHMSIQTFENLLEGIKEFPSLNQVNITGFGEPLTHPHLLDMVDALRKMHLPVVLGTNGLLLNAETAQELVKLRIERVAISMDGGIPETFSHLRGPFLSQVTEGIQHINEAKQRLGSLYPSVTIEFVATRSNIAELSIVREIAATLNVSRLLVSHVLPYTEEMCAEALYSYEPILPFKTTGWALRADAWVMWATEELPRMHWSADRRCRFIEDHAVVIGWDGQVAPCYALSHNYSYYAIDKRKKYVSRYTFGDINHQSLADIWTSEEYVRFRSAVKAYHFPSCPDCDLRETCDLREQNRGCWGWNPSCADCLWAQNIIRCP